MLPLHPHDPPAVGPYRLHARLGEDAYVRAYLAAAAGGDPVAVRVVRAEHTADARFREAFARMVADASGWESPYVCRLRAADTGGAVPWAAVDRPPGPALADLVREHGPLPAEALYGLALALARGLADLHAAGRAHGSLWPEGVVLSRGSALLADPGLEWALADPGRRAPHPSFVAPEGGTAPATDVFTWAATVSFAASGVEGAPGLPRIPLQLRGLVDACLRRGPALRPSSSDLVRMLGGDGALDPGPWPPEVLASIREAAGRQREALGAGETGGAGRDGGTDSTEETEGTHGTEGTDGTVGDGGGAGHGTGEESRVARVLALSAAGLALAVVAGVAVWEYREPASGEGEGSAAEEGSGEGAGVVTDAACRDGVGYPAPGAGADGEQVTAWDTAFSPDGDLLAVTASDTGLMVWDWREREEVARPSDSVLPGTGPVFAPVGCVVAAIVPTEYGDQEYPVSVATTFDLPSGTAAPHLGPQRGPVDGAWPARPRDAGSVSFSPDGSLLGVALEPGGDVDAGNVGLVDTRTGERTGAVAPALAFEAEFAGSGRVATNDGGTVTVWDTETGEELHTVRGVSHHSFTVVPGSDEVLHLDGDRIVWWDYAERAEVASFRLPGFADVEDPYYLGAELSPDGSRVYASWFHVEGGFADGETRHSSHVWDVETGEDLFAGNGDAVPFRSVSVHPGGEVLAAVTPEDRVALVDAQTLEPLGPPLF
ncbi:MULTISPECIES: protein kinase family protein [Nocardiopsis]|uniref:Acyl-ACP thioesterase n=1 Tax=Nocardiopsis sinuspersici TaxID=501010 RepID=A0A1V3C5J5_9ACTN|nr:MULTISPECIES: protein kinase family protein [Nocardiopsis]OOC55918.1 acyl-ACP thioesterase [Nocardiopsis sinuspersici]